MVIRRLEIFRFSVEIKRILGYRSKKYQINVKKRNNEENIGSIRKLNGALNL